ncbi:hypothetical protein [Sphingobium sp. YR768]|uniref:hypothetical protein n=1 Tax=Sphingobium sp. YR768 TaxID=1884365 RepID=UPI00115FE126|nr:hypothetical protein [Sphingobium sp. YR768]
MTYPSRTPEARRAEYLRNIEAVKRREARRKECIEYARRILAREIGCQQADVPIAMAEARFKQINLRRAIRSAQQDALYPAACGDYESGLTVRQIAEKYGFDRGRVTAILKAVGIIPKFRAYCKNGHEFSGSNLLISKEGFRRCRQCSRDNSARHALKVKASN